MTDRLLLDEYDRCVSLYAQVVASADACADTEIEPLQEYVCDGCSRLATDFALVRFHGEKRGCYRDELRCDSCRAHMSTLFMDGAA